MQDHTRLPESWNPAQGRPVHGTPCRKVYDFGMGDAELTVFRGCRCAVAQQFDPVGILQYSPVYFTSYAHAAGLARLCALEHAARYG